jgi:hypothetical protein
MGGIASVAAFSTVLISSVTVDAAGTGVTIMLRVWVVESDKEVVDGMMVVVSFNDGGGWDDVVASTIGGEGGVLFLTGVGGNAVADGSTSGAALDVIGCALLEVCTFGECVTAAIVGCGKREDGTSCCTLVAEDVC